MAYLDIIPLADAKVYLRVDDTLTEDDANITRMIKSALSRVEVMTNIYLFERDKEYVFDDRTVLVYDYPINTLVSPTDAVVSDKTLYSIYCALTSDDLTLTLNIGYTDVSDIPIDLIEVAYEMIDIMYYAKENKLSMMSKNTIDNYRRFII